MSNSYYAPGKQRATKVRALFARIARRYDLLNDLQSCGLHRIWKRRAIELAGVKPGSSVLDLCCGTGDLAFGLAQKGACVIGLDFSNEMLDIARARQQSAAKDSRCNNFQTIQFIQGDAQVLPFPRESFDAVTVGYGLRNLVNWEAGLAEMVRVVKPGGQVVVLDFGKPDNPGWRMIYFTYLRVMVPILGLLFCADAAAYAYILKSLKQYPAQHGVDAKMRGLGLTDLRILNFFGAAMTINCGRKPVVSLPP